MPDTPSVTVMKRFIYRNAPEDWGTTYHFSGTTPGNAADWLALINAIWAEERKMLSNTVKLSGGYGYVAGNEHSVYQANIDTAGLATTSGAAPGGSPGPGDVAGWVRWTSTKRNSKGRPVYGRNYYHGIGLTGQDGIDPATRTAMQAFGAKMIDGTLPGGFKKCLPQGEVLSNPKVPTYASFHELKRKGKNPSS